MTSLSSLTIERFVLGELPPDERHALERALAADPDLRQRVETVKASNAAILEQHAGAVMRGAIRERARAARPFVRRGAMLAWATSITAVVIVSAVLLRPVAPDRAAPESIRSKGAISILRVFRKTSLGSEPLSSGARASKGDLVRLGYQTFAPRYGVILSVDGRNNITRHWPSRGDLAQPLQSGGLVLLDQAFELDDAPRFERFYLVTGNHGFPIESAVALLRVGEGRGGERGAAAQTDLELTSVELHKEPSQ